MILLSRKLFLSTITVLFLLITVSVPASAQDLPVGGSRWCIGKNNIVVNIDLKTPLLLQIKGVREGHYNFESISDDQLRQIADDIIQPYVNKKLSVTVNDKTYPLKVNKIVNTGAVFTIWLSADGVSFDKPANLVKIDYRLLFEETNNVHINLAYGYFSDATGDALQKVFDYTPPTFQTIFDFNNPVWEFTVKESMKR